MSELEKMTAIYRGKAEENDFISPQFMSDEDILPSLYEDDRHYNI